MHSLDGKGATKIFLERTEIYKNEISSWLPKRIFDIHVHLGREEDHAPLSLERKKKAMAPSYSYCLTFEEFSDIYEGLLIGKEIKMLCFPFPFKETLINKANDYLIKKSNCCLILPYFYNKNDLNELLDKINVFGIKVYYDFVTDKEYSNIDISDFVSNDVLESIDKRKQILMLHVPKDSLNDSKNIAWINEVLTKYPNIKLILAHMGRCHNLKNIKSALDNIKITPNLFLESSTVSEKEVFKFCLEKLGPNKLLFGSDLPYALKRGKIFDIPGPKGGALITEDVHDWTLDEHRKWYLENKPALTYMFYHSIVAIKESLEDLGLEKYKEDIFYNNAAKLLNLF